MKNREDNLIVQMTFQYALGIIKFTESLESIKKFNIANQLFRAGTGIGANVWEAQNSESKADFIHKIKIAAKEADETNYWLLLCKESESYPECNDLIKKLDDIINVLSKIIISSKRN